ncbi:MAG: hypothetical protein MZV70_77010 [Desulfobacterales bacterium]|nr:hypothetical protein [Desulfobacterales bacterium]
MVDTAIGFQGVGAISITDHDNILSYKHRSVPRMELKSKEAGKDIIEIIPGVEDKHNMEKPRNSYFGLFLWIYLPSLCKICLLTNSMPESSKQ